VKEEGGGREDVKMEGGDKREEQGAGRGVVGG